MNCEICLVRHGVTDWNRERRIQGQLDVPLNAEGLRQARCTASRLAAERWDALYSSDLRRAAQTAECIASATGLPLILESGLRERRFGPAIEGLTYGEARERVPDFWVLSPLRGDRLPPGLEPPEAFEARALATLERIAAAHPGGRVIAVAHGAFISAFLAAVSGGKPGSGRTGLENGSLTRVRRLAAPGADGRWEVDAVNDVAHLGPGVSEAAG